jgi:hypothetical protein
MQVYDFRKGSIREPEAMEDHLTSYLAARKRLVEQRSALIKALALGYQAEQTEAHINMVIRVQEAIEVVDKAISEEQPAPQRA